MMGQEWRQIVWLSVILSIPSLFQTSPPTCLVLIATGEFRYTIKQFHSTQCPSSFINPDNWFQLTIQSLPASAIFIGVKRLHQQKRQLSEANFLSCAENWHTNISNMHRFFFLSNLKDFSRAKREVWNFGIIKNNHFLHTVALLCYVPYNYFSILSFFNNSGLQFVTLWYP